MHQQHFSFKQTKQKAVTNMLFMVSFYRSKGGVKLY